MPFLAAPPRRFVVLVVFLVAVGGTFLPLRASASAPVPVAAFCGTYDLVNPPRQRRRVREAVDHVIDQMSFLIRGIARGRAHAKIYPEPRVAVARIHDGGFVLSLGSHRTLACLPDGILRRPPKAHGEVRCWRDDTHLVQQFVGGDATSTITVWLAPGGHLLHARIRVVNPWFPRPIVFQLLYRRRSR